MNLSCGRNPWKRASIEDPTFRAFLKDPNFLSTILQISQELEAILRRIFDCNPATRITLPELRKQVLRCSHFTAQPQRPLTPPLMDYDPVPEPVAIKVVEPQSVAQLPPSPPQTPPALSEVFFKPTAATSPSPPASQPEAHCQAYLTPSSSQSSRIPAPTPKPAGQCAPLIGTDLFNFVPALGSWVRPSAFPSHAVPSLVST